MVNVLQIERRLREQESFNVSGIKSSANFLGSSAVERSAVNRLVVGSNPTRGDSSIFSGIEDGLDDVDNDTYPQ